MADLATYGALLVNVALAFILIQVGRVIIARRPHGPGAPAAIAFAIWWFTLAALQLGAVLDLAVTESIGWTFGGFLTYVQVVILAIVVALAALVYYMVYIFTGRRGAWKPVAVGYGAALLLTFYWLALSAPEGITQGNAGTELVYGNDQSDSTLGQAIGLVLIGPPLVAAVAYLTLFFRVEDRSQKFRIAAIGGAFATWFGISLLVGQFTDWQETAAWGVISSAITFLAATTVYVAFQPPAWMRRRLHIHGFGERHD